MKTLVSTLKDWTDIDVVAHELAKLLGMVSEERDSFQVHKWVYWGDNKYGSMLYRTLMNLADPELLEYDNEEMKIRANPVLN